MLALCNSGPNQGAINVTDGGPYGANTWYGRITEDGKFIQSRHCTELVKALVLAMAQNPTGTALEYGNLTGNCCFCGKALTDEKSTAAGMGKTCAGHWDLLDHYNAAGTTPVLEVENLPGDDAEAAGVDQEVVWN